MNERQSFRLALLVLAFELAALLYLGRPHNVGVVLESLRCGETRWTDLRAIRDTLYP